MSQLDKFQLFEDWCMNWPNCVQVALVRGFSNHYPIMLFVDEENWGLKLIHKLKCWSNFPGYIEFMID